MKKNIGKMPMYKRLSLVFMALTITLLSGCNDRIVDEANKVNSEKIKHQQEIQDLQDKQLKALEENTTPIEKALETLETEKETKETLENEQIDEQTEFANEEEFAQYVANILFNFFTGDLSPEKYYEFISKHGSLVLLKDINPEKKDVMIKGYADIQRKLIENGTKFVDYKISELTFDETGIYAYFYRTLISEDGEEVNYITTIVKEKNGWKYDSDHLSQGYTEKEGRNSNDFK